MKLFLKILATVITITTAHAVTTLQSFTVPSMSDNTEVLLGTVDLSSISSLTDISVSYDGTALHSATNPFAFEGDLSYNFDHIITLSGYDTGGSLLFSIDSFQYEVVQTTFSVLPGETLQESFSDTQSFSDFVTGSFGDVDIRASINQIPGGFSSPFNTFDGVENATFSVEINGISVPEPSSALLLGVAGLGLLTIRRRR